MTMPNGDEYEGELTAGLPDGYGISKSETSEAVPVLAQFSQVTSTAVSGNRVDGSAIGTRRGFRVQKATAGVHQDL